MLSEKGTTMSYQTTPPEKLQTQIVFPIKAK